MRRLVSLVALLIIAASVAPPVTAQEASPGANPAGECVALGEAENEAVAVRFFTEALGQGDLDAIDEIYAPDGRHNAAFFPVAPSTEEIKGFLGALRVAFPDIQITMDHVISDGEFVVVHWTQTGKFEGPLQGYPPTGEPVTWTGINIFELDCGQIVESWAVSDTLTQLGLGVGTDAESLATPAVAATPAADCVASSEAENAAVAEQLTEVWNTRDTSFYEDLSHPVAVHDVGLGDAAVGVDAIQEYHQALYEAFPNLAVVQEEVIADGDLVVIRFSATGTHEGAFFGIESTGTEAIWAGITIYRFECGQVVERWSDISGFDLFRQLGALEPVATPAPAPAAEHAAAVLGALRLRSDARLLRAIAGGKPASWPDLKDGNSRVHLD